jgi:hypothetical protein
VKKNRYFVITLMCFMMFISCVTVKPISKPSWIMNSSVSGKVTGIGVCGMHVNGVNAQRSLAIKRAIDEIAMQLGVKVNNVALVGTKSGAGGGGGSVESYSFQTVEGQVVKAIIKETWKDPKTEEIYVWMVTE